MSLTPRRLRRLFAAGAVIAVLVSAFFYLHGILKNRTMEVKLLKNIPANLDKTGKGLHFHNRRGRKRCSPSMPRVFSSTKMAERPN